MPAARLFDLAGAFGTLAWSGAVDGVVIEALGADAVEAEAAALGAVLHACVQDGASVGFVLPFPVEEAEAWWRGSVAPAVRRGVRLVLVARCGGEVAGTVQLDWDTPPNQPHRAEVRKLLVHPGWRGRGVARALMAAVEARARALGRVVLTLDTRTGDAAEPLYESLGYRVAGVIPRWCVDVRRERFDATTVMYRFLDGAAVGAG